MEVHLSLSDKCGGNCVFCPKHLTNKKLSNMSFELAKRVIDQLKYFDITEVQLGENGDCFFNPDFLKIARYLRKKYPLVKVIVYTNFQNLNKDLSETILREGLVDNFNCNIDSVLPNYYHYIKKMDYKHNIENVKSFIRLRDEINPKVALNVFIINLLEYLVICLKLFDSPPSKVPDINLVDVVNDDYDFTNQELLKIINPKIDKIHNIPTVLWAERDKDIVPGYKRTDTWCPYTILMDNCIFISPTGLWYMCCLDDTYRQVFGDVNKDSLKKIYNSKKRKALLDKIKAKDFNGIGYPCNKVYHCRSYGMRK